MNDWVPFFSILPKVWVIKVGLYLSNVTSLTFCTFHAGYCQFLGPSLQGIKCALVALDKKPSLITQNLNICWLATSPPFRKMEKISLASRELLYLCMLLCVGPFVWRGGEGASFFALEGEVVFGVDICRITGLATDATRFCELFNNWNHCKKVV